MLEVAVTMVWQRLHSGNALFEGGAKDKPRLRPKEDDESEEDEDDEIENRRSKCMSHSNVLCLRMLTTSSPITSPVTLC